MDLKVFSYIFCLILNKIMALLDYLIFLFREGYFKKLSIKDFYEGMEICRNFVGSLF